MTSKITKYKLHFLILLVGLLWLSLMNALLQLNQQNGIYADSENYKESADFLYHHFQFHYYRPILMAAITGVPYLFGFSDSSLYDFSFFVNMVCWLATSLILFELMKDFLSERKALQLTLFFFLLLGCLVSIFHLLTESLYIFATTNAFYLLSKFYKTRRIVWLSAALSVFILVMLIKPGAQYFAILLLIYFSKTLFNNRNKSSLVLVGLALLLCGIQLCVMKKQYGNYTISYVSGVTYYNYLGAKAISFKTQQPLKEIQRQRMDSIFALSYSDQQATGFSDLKKQIRHNSLNLVKAYCSNLLDNARTPSEGICINQNVTKDFHVWFKKAAFFISKWQNRLMTFAGIVLALHFFLRARCVNFYSLVGCYILYVFFISGFSFYQGDRFNIVFFPFVILLGSYWLKNRRQTN
ncbi:MAG: glycosyltransferase family 39 protein [Burkholderiales bacterium]|nr:glycosyltransferase family 39 protein [Flavobacterium sp.]